MQYPRVKISGQQLPCHTQKGRKRVYEQISKTVTVWRRLLIRSWGFGRGIYTSTVTWQRGDWRMNACFHPFSCQYHASASLKPKPSQRIIDAVDPTHIILVSIRRPGQCEEGGRVDIKGQMKKARMGLGWGRQGTQDAIFMQVLTFRIRQMLNPCMMRRGGLVCHVQ